MGIKRFVAGIALACIVVAVTGLMFHRMTRALGGRGEGRLEFEPRFLDMGFVCPGEVPTFTVHVKNVGDGRLELGSVDASCGCTDLKLAHASLAPGSETLLTGRLRLSLKEQVFNHLVWIMDSTNKRRLGQFVLRGRAAWPVQVSTELVHLGNLQPGSAATAEVQIYSAQRAPFEIRSITASAPFIHVTRQDFIKGRMNLAIRVDAPPGGIIDEALTIRTSHPKRPVLMVSIQGRVRGEVWLASSPRLFLGVRAAGDRVERALTLRCTQPDAGTVRGVLLEGEGWQLADWHYAAGEGSTTVVLKVAVIVPQEAGNHECTLRVQTARDPPLEASVSCIVLNTGEK